MAKWKLIDEKTGEEVKLGSAITDFRGKQDFLRSFAAPKHEGSTGRLYIQAGGIYGSGYYPSVYGLKFVEVES